MQISVHTQNLGCYEHARARRTHARACARETIHQPSIAIIPEEGAGAAAAFLCHYYFLRT
jgi:hypothetical protein